MTQIGKNIKKIRNVKGISQQAFADLFGLTRGNISSYEEFRADPKLEVVVKIANYFSIPLADFIEKDLSVNELLHYNTELVLETEKYKLIQQLKNIPYIPALYINDYIANYKDETFLSQMPVITIPSNSKFRQIALEVDNQEMLPAKFDYHNNDILILEEVVKENIHRIIERLGIIVDQDGIKSGIYKQTKKGIILSLNEYVEHPFDPDSNKDYWVLKSAIVQGIQTS